MAVFLSVQIAPDQFPERGQRLAGREAQREWQAPQECDGGVLFYLITDRLCLFTIFSIYARKLRIVVLGLWIMFTHIHLMIRPVDPYHLSSFIDQSLSTFSRVINADRSRKGHLFRRRYGSAPKVTDKEKRSSLIYLYNNPVEKRLCKKAVEDRWTFLAYCQNPFPYSERLVKRNASFNLRQAADYVDKEYEAGRYLLPARLRRLFSRLSKNEQEQLTDYIINKYQFIRYDEALALFGDLDKLLLATEASAGKEFDVGEEFDPLSDIAYREMCHVSAKAQLFDNWKLLHLTQEEEREWARRFRQFTSGTDRQINKFLHLPDEKA